LSFYKHAVILLFTLILLISVYVTGITPATAIAVPVRVTIEHVHATVSDFDSTSEADFFPRVTIDGTGFGYDPTDDYHDDYDNEDSIDPNWVFEQPVDPSRGSIPITIEIFDQDGGFNFVDNEADIDSRPGHALEFSVKVIPCTLTGDVDSICGASITSGGTEGETAEIRFHIDVIDTSAPGLRVSCTHTPVWPQATDAITINATALDGSLVKKPLTDSIEIWVDRSGITAPAKVGSGTELLHAIGPFPASQTFAYGCLVRDGGVSVFSGWKVVNVGLPLEGRAIPIVFTGSQSTSADIVFIPNTASYTGAADARFLSDLDQIIKAYLAEDIYNINQDKINFWIAQDAGTANVVPPHTGPANWNTAYTFADAGAIVHRGSIPRDFASGDFFSGDVTRIDPDGKGGTVLWRVFLHETGHRPFGLADEYCCDGGYFQSSPAPNLYAENVDCTGDVPIPGSSCRTFTDTHPAANDWFTSDTSNKDLMVDNLAAQNLDIRRFNWMFGECDAGKC
jgi:hypothetical protein